VGYTIVIAGAAADEKRLRALVDQIKALVKEITGADVHVNLQISKKPGR